MLVARCDPMRHRMTVLMAAGGFGKTVLLAECCRRARSEGALVAWVALDEHDDPETLVSYFALAFAEAGAPFEFDDSMSHANTDRHRLDALLHWIGMIEGDVVIALDEVDRLEPASVALVDYLAWRGPANLHLAMAFRTRPRGLDIATPVVEGRGLVLSGDDLRFQRQDIARYFDTSLSREQLRSLWEESNGWPFAVCVQRNVADRFARAASGEISLNWVETRLLRGFSESDRTFVLEVGLFEWADEDLLERVLKEGASRRLRSLTALAGLVQQVEDGASFRLHPLLRRYAADAMWRTARPRFSSINRRIALVLAERGRVIEAMQHALEADDPRLAGRILERSGGIRVGMREGLYRLRQAIGMVPRDVMRRSLRLALVDCGVSAIYGDVRAAVRRFAELNTRIAETSGEVDREMEVDLALSRGVFAVFGCAPIGTPEMDAVVADIERLAGDDSGEEIVRASAQYCRALFAYERADFANADAWAVRSMNVGPEPFKYLAVSADIMRAGIRVVRGETDDAETIFGRAARIAKRDYAYDSIPLIVGDVLLGELDLERNRTSAVQHRIHSAAKLAQASAWLDVYVAATDMSAEMAARANPDRAVSVYDRARDFAQQTMRPRLGRCLASLQVSTLVRLGRHDEARDVWESAGLPSDAAACLDLSRQSWREMEAICTSRVRLLATLGQFAAARSLGREFAAVARDRNLVRALTYANAVSIYAAWGMGDIGGVREHVVENLELFERTGYCRAMLWHPESTLAALQEFGDDIDEGLEAARDAVLEMVSTDADDDTPQLTPRELEILAWLEHARDKEIARELGLTDNGVRYHVKNIFRKLGVGDRRAAVNRARTLGLTAPDEPD